MCRHRQRDPDTVDNGSPVVPAVACQCQAAELRRRSMAEIAARKTQARRALAGYDFASHPHAPFLWLKLPDPWFSGTFKTAALREDVLIDDEDEFKADRLDRSFYRVRIAFSSAGREEVGVGLECPCQILDSGAACYDGEI